MKQMAQPGRHSAGCRGRLCRSICNPMGGAGGMGRRVGWMTGRSNTKRVGGRLWPYLLLGPDRLGRCALAPREQPLPIRSPMTVPERRGRLPRSLIRFLHCIHLATPHAPCRPVSRSLGRPSSQPWRISRRAFRDCGLTRECRARATDEAVPPFIGMPHPLIPCFCEYNTTIRST